MNSSGWFLLVGGLMLAIGLTAPVIKRLPVTLAITYLAVGLLVGPTGLGLFHFNLLKESALLEVLTEVAVLISLFAAGVKMPVPVTFARWRMIKNLNYSKAYIHHPAIQMNYITKEYYL